MKIYKIVSEPLESGEAMVPAARRSEVDEIYYGIQKGKPSAKKKLDKLLSRYPHVPSLWNFLSVWYEVTGNAERAKEIVNQMYHRFPGYLFSIVNSASFAIKDGDFARAYRLLGNGDLDISTLYPNREVFHITEYEAYVKVAVHYLAATGQFDQAEAYIRKMKDEKFSQDFVSRLQSLVFSQLLKRAGEKMEKSGPDGVNAIERTEPAAGQVQALLTAQNERYDYLYESDLWNVDPGLIKEDIEEDPEGLNAELHYILRRAVEVMDYTYEKDVWTPVVLHAALLLAYTDPQKGFEAFLELYSQPRKYTGQFLGDWDTELLPVYFKQASGPMRQSIKTFILQPGVPVSNKNLMLECLKDVPDAAWLSKIVEELMTELREQKGNPAVMDSSLFAFVVGAAIDIRAVNLLPVIEKLYEDKLVSITVEGDFEVVKKNIQSPQPENKHELFNDVFEHLAKLNQRMSHKDRAFADWKTGIDAPKMKPAPTEGNGYAGTPRNAKCPCGSGKKYKHCHGAA